MSYKNIKNYKNKKNNKSKKIALFDIDYTIISTNCITQFLIYIIKKKPLKIIYLPILFFLIILWLFRLISIDSVKSLFFLPIKGMEEKDLEKISEEFIYSMIIPKLKFSVIDIINDFKKKGYLIIFATASYEFYIKFLSEYLKADYYFGTKLKMKNNKITLKIDGDNCKGKEKINRILTQLPIENIERAGSVGFSDEISDLPFLELVETFYLIKSNKWKIIKEFKR